MERKHFYPRPEWDNFERMIEIMLEMPLPLLQQLAELPGEAGEYNKARLEWWSKVWIKYCELVGREE